MCPKVYSLSGRMVPGWGQETERQIERERERFGIVPVGSELQVLGKYRESYRKHIVLQKTAVSKR